MVRVLAKPIGHWLLMIGSAVLLWFAVQSPAVAEPRIALVIGNGDYRRVNPLPNPASDARLMAQTLESAGFVVTLVADGDLAEMREAVTAFGAALREAGTDATGLFYYAGHGVQSFQRNYLLPVDVKLENAADLGLAALEAESVLRQMASARNKTNIFILDACRNNPFENLRDLDDNGLAEMKAPPGTYLAYATEPNKVALDGTGANSVFTAALTGEILTPGQPIEQVFKRVRVKVLAASGNLQTPWDASSLSTNFVFVAGATAAEDSAEDALWDSVRRSRDAVQIILFLRSFPEGRHDAEAKALLAEVMAGEVAPATPEPATPEPATPEPATPEPAASDPVAAIPEPPAPQADPAVASTGTAEDAEAAFNLAQAAGTPAGYDAFLAAYPDSGFVEIARAELEALLAAPAKAAPESVAVTDTPALDVSAAEALERDLGSAPILFSQALITGPAEFVGKSLEQLILSTPKFPPIDGLPEEVWKEQHCTNCHQWTQAALCDQGNFYVSQPIERSVNKDHPLGGGFKLILRKWAESGCL